MAVGIQIKSKPLDQVRADVPLIQERTVRVNLNVPESLRQRWKMAAVQAKRPLTDLIVDAMDQYLRTQEAHKQI
jgi:hypothetical protein